MADYPNEEDLSFIEKWDVYDVVGLLDYIEGIWWNSDWGFRKIWGKDSIQQHRPVIYLELHTGGWSGNEDIIDALLKNQMFTWMWYSQWNRGGHYKFEIDPMSIGYKSASELAKEQGVSRQYVHKSKYYDRIKVSNGKILFRLKSLKNTANGKD